MALHPREARFGRREFVGRSAGGIVGLSSLSTILAACGGGNGGGSSAADLQLARPDNPVTWPIYDDNPPIASGLEPEKGPLKIYNWNGYLWPRIMKDFGKEYGVEVQLSTFSTTDESMAKISSGAVDYDVFFPYQERLGRMVLGKLLQPLNHDYVPNLAEDDLARAPRSVLRQGVAVHGPVHDLHDRDRLPDRQGRHDAVGSREPVRDLLGRAQQGEDVPPRRRPRGADPHAAEERDHGHEHGEARATSTSRRTSSSRSRRR